MDTICLYQGWLWEKECFSSRAFFFCTSGQQKLKGKERGGEEAALPETKRRWKQSRRRLPGSTCDFLSRSTHRWELQLVAVSQRDTTRHVVPVQTNPHTCPNKEQHPGQLAAGPGPSEMTPHCKALPSPLHFPPLLNLQGCSGVRGTCAPHVCPSPAPSSPAPRLLFRLSFCLCKRLPARLSARHSHRISDSYRASFRFLSAPETSVALLSDTVRPTQT